MARYEGDLPRDSQLRELVERIELNQTEPTERNLTSEVVEPAGSDPAPPKSKRKLLQFARFNLKLFLILVTLFCIYMAWHMQRTKAQRNAVEAFQAYGGWLRYDYQFVDGKFDAQAKSKVPSWLLDGLGIDFFHAVVEINCVYTNDYGGREDNSNSEPAPLEQLAGFPRLKFLYLKETQATDDNLAHVGKLSQLVDFYIWDAYEITDQGVAHLDGLKRLDNIHLSESKITDESLRVFGKMRSLTRLALQFNTLSDEGVKHLRDLGQLESLWICGKAGHLDYAAKPNFESTPRTTNEITDKSLQSIALWFPKLKWLGIQGTLVTREGVDAFLEAIPNCKISHGQYDN